MKHILVPVDGSDCTGLILEKAKEMAKCFGSRITLLNVYDIPYMSYNIDMGYNPWVNDIMDSMIKRSQLILDNAKNLCADMGDQVDTVSLEGNPANQIIDYVCKHDDIDLVIMGSYGMSGFQRFFLGSTTHKVTVALEKPILII